jgi:hypothetical protein
MTLLRQCPGPECRTQISPDRFACINHWYALPDEIRNEIWRTYRARLRARGSDKKAAIADHQAAMARGIEFLESSTSRPSA